MEARRVVPRVRFKERAISDIVNSITYNDTEDLTDDISITVVDTSMIFADNLFPSVGDVLTVGLKIINHPSGGKNDYINLGNFEVDDFSQQQTVTINGVSVPITSSARGEKKYRTWEKIRLSTILNDMAKSMGLGSIYDCEYDPLYDKQEQSNESDLEFLSSLAKNDGMAIKISCGKLVIFDKAKYDSAKPVAKIIRGQTNITGEPSFKCSAKGIYSSCEITFTDNSNTKKVITNKGSFSAPEPLGVKRVLRKRESYNSKTDDINFKRKAKSALREQNENQWTATVELIGNCYYYAGTNVELCGWNKWDGKYHITQASHTISSNGFITTLSLRRCLEGY